MGHSRFLTFLKFRAKMSKFDGRWVMVGIQGFEEQMVLTKEKDHSIETQRRHDAVFNKKNKVIMDVKTMGTKRVFHRHFGYVPPKNRFFLQSLTTFTTFLRYF